MIEAARAAVAIAQSDVVQLSGADDVTLSAPVL